MTLLRADDYRSDWYGYVTNQAGIIGLVLGALALTVLPPVAVVPVVALAICLVAWLSARCGGTCRNGGSNGGSGGCDQGR